MTPSPAHRFSQFRLLIDRAEWRALPAARGEDVQGPDVRARIGKDGVVFSAYPIPRGPGHFGEVDLDPLPQWAESNGLRCDIPVEELCAQLGFAGDPERSFEFLDSRLEEVRASLNSDAFARTKLDRAIVMLNQRSAVHRDMLYELRPQIGLLGLMNALFSAYLSHRSELSRYRRALRSLSEDSGPARSV